MYFTCCIKYNFYLGRYLVSCCHSVCARHHPSCSSAPPPSLSPRRSLIFGAVPPVPWFNGAIPRGPSFSSAQFKAPSGCFFFVSATNLCTSPRFSLLGTSLVTSLSLFGTIPFIPPCDSLPLGYFFFLGATTPYAMAHSSVYPSFPAALYLLLLGTIPLVLRSDAKHPTEIPFFLGTTIRCTILVPLCLPHGSLE